jgi:hypothetical protein
MPSPLDVFLAKNKENLTQLKQFVDPITWTVRDEKLTCTPKLSSEKTHQLSLGFGNKTIDK